MCHNCFRNDFNLEDLCVDANNRVDAVQIWIGEAGEGFNQYSSPKQAKKNKTMSETKAKLLGMHNEIEI